MDSSSVAKHDQQDAIRAANSGQSARSASHWHQPTGHTSETRHAINAWRDSSADHHPKVIYCVRTLHGTVHVLSLTISIDGWQPGQLRLVIPSSCRSATLLDTFDGSGHTVDRIEKEASGGKLGASPGAIAACAQHPGSLVNRCNPNSTHRLNEPWPHGLKSRQSTAPDDGGWEPSDG